MNGLKKYTHEEKQKIVEELLPLIREKFGDNLVAFAAQGSFARNDDGAYSDLELHAFVKEGEGGAGKIVNGMLIELTWSTREKYIEGTLEVNKMWFISGSDKLFPIINHEFINELSGYRIENLKEKCLQQAKNHWHEVQESTAKTLNAVAAFNHENLPLVFGDMIVHMLVSLSFLNQTPYVTFARFISQARLFETKPASFDDLLDIFTERKFDDLPHLEKTIERVFTEFEAIFENAGVALYDKELKL